MDRRIRKTREAIHKALIELLSEKDFDQITIHEIADRANLNRGTIYLHYIDKYDLLDKCIEEHLSVLLKLCIPDKNESPASPYAYSLLPAFLYFEEHALFYTSLLNNKGVPYFRDRLMEIMTEGIQQQINMEGMNKGLDRQVVIEFLTSASVGVMEWWIINKMPIPAVQIAEEMKQILDRNH